MGDALDILTLLGLGGAGGLLTTLGLGDLRDIGEAANTQAQDLASELQDLSTLSRTR